MPKIKSFTSLPSPKLLSTIGATNLAFADAIAEIVANSFDAARPDEKACVEVTVSGSEVCVVDDGVGMDEEVLVEAVRLGVDMDRVMQRAPGAKGCFGLGMKTACASIGDWWAIHTRPPGAGVEYRVVFDLNEWRRRPDAPEAWTINVEELDLPTDGPLGDRDHGTAILVRKLHQRDPLVGAVLAKLGEAFKPHLGRGDSIVVNGDPATPHRYDFVPNSEVEVDLTFGPKDEYRINGWVAIDRQNHGDGDYGFNIYRKGQLVETWNQDWFAGHLMTSRIIGEVHMDFIAATFLGQGLQQNDTWHQASVEMREFLKPVVKASRELSRKGNINSTVTAQNIIRDMHAGLGIIPTGGGAEGGTAANDRSSEGISSRTKSGAQSAKPEPKSPMPTPSPRARRARPEPTSEDGRDIDGLSVKELTRLVRQLQRDVEKLKSQER